MKTVVSHILWHHAVSGEPQMWFIDGERLVGRRTVIMAEPGHPEFGKPALVGLPWSIVGTGDFDRNGNTDILWHNAVSGESQIWLIDRERLVGRRTVIMAEPGHPDFGKPALVGLPWSIVGAGAALVLPEIALRFVGFHCFGETDEFSAADEPYFTFGVVPNLVEQKNTLQTRIFDDVDAGESKGDLIELYRGLPLGAAISITLVEHDEGNPEKYRENVARAVERTADRVIEGLAHIPAVGVALAVLGEVAFVVALPAITDAVNELLGTEDDLIGTVTLALSPNDMTRLVRADRQNFHGIQAHLESPLISGDGSSYKAYFDVIEV